MTLLVDPEETPQVFLSWVAALALWQCAPVDYEQPGTDDVVDRGYYGPWSTLEGFDGFVARLAREGLVDGFVLTDELRDGCASVYDCVQKTFVDECVREAFEEAGL